MIGLESGCVDLPGAINKATSQFNFVKNLETGMNMYQQRIVSIKRGYL